MRTPAWLVSDEPSRRRRVRIYGTMAIAFAALLSLWLVTRPFSNGGGDPDEILRRGTFTPTQRHDHQGENGAVACDVGVCSQMGIEILKAGGNAADAAVTVALCIGSTNFQASGLGGGGFAIVRSANGTAKFINFREAAPAAAHKHMFNGTGIPGSKFTALAVGVPGEAAGLEQIYKLFGSGKLPWSKLVKPVAEFNRHGFETPIAVQHAYELMQDYGLEFKSSDWSWAINSEGNLHSWIERPALARTLDILAEKGASAFYAPDGEIAQSIVSTITSRNGSMTLGDLSNYTAIVSDPVVVDFMGVRVFTGDAPSSGPAMAMGLTALEPLITSGPNTDLGPIETQRLVETLKWMAAARSELGDPRFGRSDNARKLLTAEWATNVRNNISDSHTLPSWRDYHPSYEMNEPHGTAHFSIIDKDGMAVSFTTTVNLPFGNLMVDNYTGIVLNSEMDDFSRPDLDNFFQLAPSRYNFVGPYKRPLSSTVPTIVAPKEGGAALLAIGAAGGSRIMPAVFQALIRLYGYNLPLLDAIARPRIHHQLLPELADAELGTPEDLIDALRSRGHKVTLNMSYTAMSGVQRVDNELHAVSDFWRKGGEAAAY